MSVGNIYALACIGLGALLCIVGVIAIFKMGMTGRFQAKITLLGELSAPVSSMILVAGIFVLVVPPYLNPILFQIKDTDVFHKSQNITALGEEDYTTALILDSYWFLPENIENVAAAEQWASLGASMFELNSIQGPHNSDINIYESLTTKSLPVSSNCGRGETEWFRDGDEVPNPCPETCDGGVPLSEEFRLKGYPPHLEKKLTFQCYMTRDDLQIPAQSLRKVLQGDP